MKSKSFTYFNALNIRKSEPASYPSKLEIFALQTNNDDNNALRVHNKQTFDVELRAT